MSIEAMKQALEALEKLTDTEQTYGALDLGDRAITVLRTALEAELRRNVATPREWVGLTIEEIADEFHKFEAASAWYQFARALEAKLKAKNFA